MSCQYTITLKVICDELHLFVGQLFIAHGGRCITTAAVVLMHLFRGSSRQNLLQVVSVMLLKSMRERVNSPKETARKNEQSNPTYHHPNDRTSRQS